MPLSPSHDEDSESRTSAIGVKRPRGRQRRGRGRNQNQNQNQNQGQVSSSPRAESQSPNPLDSISTMGNASSRPVEAPDARHDTEAPSNPSQLLPRSSGLGNNRLATGFPKPRAVLAHDPANHNSPSEATPSQSFLHDNVIEISDDEQEEGEIEEEDAENEESSDEGGMVINIDSPTSDGQPHLMDVDQDLNAGDGGNTSPSLTRDTTKSLPSSGRAAHLQLQGDLRRVANRIPETHPHPSAGSVLRLDSLSAADLEMQLKYAFFDIDPAQIDLGRAAVCLSCLREGHIEQTCPEKTCISCSGPAGQHSRRLCPRLRRCAKCHDRGHDASSCASSRNAPVVACELCGAFSHLEDACVRRFFSSDVARVVDGPIGLWISCCVCGSKTHLVGDCPGVNQALAARWSLKSFAPGQITNLSLEAGTKLLESKAANRGLRPEGMQIRGRAGLHQAGVPLSTSASDNESDHGFLGPRVGNAGASNRGPKFNFRHPQRLPSPAGKDSWEDQFDRYNPGDRSSRERPASNWYATDSFGRRRSRSRSPSTTNRNARGTDGWDGGNNSRRRSRSPRFAGAQRLDRVRSPSSQPPGALGYKSGIRENGAPAKVGRGVSVELPVRRGSSSRASQDRVANPSMGPSRQPHVATAPASKPAKTLNKKPKKGKGNAPTKRALCNTSNSQHDNQLKPLDPAPPICVKIPDTPSKKILEQFVAEINNQRQMSRKAVLELAYPPAKGPTLIDHAKLKEARYLHTEREQVEETTHCDKQWHDEEIIVISDSEDDSTSVEKRQRVDVASAPTESPTRSDSIAASDLPTPADSILGMFLNRINMKREEIGKLPVVADRLNTGALRFVDVSGPGRSRLVSDDDVEVIWRWCANSPYLTLGRPSFLRAYKDSRNLRTFVAATLDGRPMHTDAGVAQAIESTMAWSLFPGNDPGCGGHDSTAK